MGWGYEDWSGVFYPQGTDSRQYITLYAQMYRTVEIDSTFYGTPREAQVKGWAQATSADFVFCPKVPRLITHELRLVDAQEPLAEFVRVMGLLGTKRGPMLLQFPPDFTRTELPSLQRFLPVLDDIRESDGAAQFAVEFRHRSLIGSDVSSLLQSHNVALATADYAPMPRRFELTADFVYLRLIGRHGAYEHHRFSQSDRTPDLTRWANVLRENASKFSTAYVFCNNDYEGYSPLTADRMLTLLGQSVPAPPAPVQGSLF